MNKCKSCGDGLDSAVQREFGRCATCIASFIKACERELRFHREAYPVELLFMP